MKKIITGIFCSLSLLIFLSSCFDLYWRRQNSLRNEAYVPVYGFDSASRTIVSLPPQPIMNAGKIYTYGYWVFQVDNDLGIHVINCSDKINPVKMGFIRIGGCREVAIRNQYLLTNNLNDMVTIDISDVQHVKLKARIQKAFKAYNNYNEYKRPPEKGKYFECPNFYEGDVVGWKLEKNVYADCYNQ